MYQSVQLPWFVLVAHHSAPSVASVVEVFSRGTDLISVDGTPLHAASCQIISHVGEDNPSLAAQTQAM